VFSAHGLEMALLPPRGGQERFLNNAGGGSRALLFLLMGSDPVTHPFGFLACVIHNVKACPAALKVVASQSLTF
jgi:hypothetical protein